MIRILNPDPRIQTGISVKTMTGSATLATSLKHYGTKAPACLGSKQNQTKSSNLFQSIEKISLVEFIVLYTVQLIFQFILSTGSIINPSTVFEWVL